MFGLVCPLPEAVESVSHFTRGRNIKIGLVYCVLAFFVDFLLCLGGGGGGRKIKNNGWFAGFFNQLLFNKLVKVPVNDGSTEIKFSPNVFNPGFARLLYELVNVGFGGCSIFHIVYSLHYTVNYVKLV